jgi:hypothetical protein
MENWETVLGKFSNGGNSIEALDEAFGVVTDSLRLYAYEHNLPDSWLEAMQSRLSESLLELKASIYLEAKCGAYFSHANSRILSYTQAVLGKNNPNKEWSGANLSGGKSLVLPIYGYI